MGAGIEWMASLPPSEGAAVTLEVAEPAAPDSLTTEVAPATTDALAETPSE
jgi:hypothetical protein